MIIVLHGTKEALRLRGRCCIKEVFFYANSRTRIKVPRFHMLIFRVRHRFRATFSRQPRQVRKEATVTGSFVCSGAPVPDFFC